MPEIFISKEAVAVFWFWIGLAAIITGAVMTYQSVSAAGLRSQFILMQPDNSLIQRMDGTREHDEEQQRHVTTLMTRLLLDSIFNKSLYGLDAGDRAQRLMTPETWATVKETLIDLQEQNFRQRTLHQKLTVTKINIQLTEDLEASDVMFEGTLILSGLESRRLFNQEWKLRGSLSWKRNECLRDCERYPLVCDDFICAQKLDMDRTRALDNAEQASLARNEEKDKNQADTSGAPPAAPKAP